MDRRRAFTLLELIVVLSIVAVLVALLIPAVMRVRAAALAAQCANRQRQLILATHQYAGDHSGEFPCFAEGRGRPARFPTNADLTSGMPWEDCPPHVQLMSYIDQGAAFRVYRTKPADLPGGVAAFRCPLDPSHARSELGPAMSAVMTSYALNMQVFFTPIRLEAGLPDGLAATIAFGEHYARCKSLIFDFFFDDGFSTVSARPVFAGLSVGGPVTRGQPPVSSGRDVPVGSTFQLRPAEDDCRWSLAQTGHHAGMSVAMADGSVRVIRAGVAPAAYWAATTPAGGEVAPLD